MGISRISRNEWIQVDQNYLERINYRRILLKNEQRYCIGSIPASRPAIEELYEEVMINHLPKRFPNMFSIEDNIFTNHVTRCRYLIDVSALTEAYMLNVLAENVEEDFYFMCSDGNGEYRLQAFSSCFPQGLLSSSKLGLSVREIHKPVPGYESRLGNGVDRYFRRMEPEMFFGRLNVRVAYATPERRKQYLVCRFVSLLISPQISSSGVSKPTVPNYFGPWPKIPAIRIFLFPLRVPHQIQRSLTLRRHIYAANTIL